MSLTEPVAEETVTVTIDGLAVAARPNELVIAAAERAGIYIPRFCYHPRMRPVGMCRMCLVEQETPRGPALVVSCMIEAADGMVISTQSPTVKKAQDGVLEFLLVNHPLDCPVCDKGGECPLQDQTLSFGPGETRFVEEKRHHEKPIALSELVSIDRERCILCDRCTRFQKEVAGDALIHFQQRGAHTEVNTFPDHPFASYFSGNTVQICPVGALLSRPYRFKARPWDIEQVESTCQTCAVGCRMALQSSTDALVRFLGVDSDAVNHGWLCDKGRFNYEALADPERLAEPRLRGEPGTWGEALDEAAAALRAADPARVGVIGGARLTNEDAYAWARLAKGVIGTDNVDAQLGDGLPAEVVLGLPRATIDDAVDADLVISLAPDLKEELPVLFLRLREAIVDRELRVVELAPRSTSLSGLAAVSVRYRPGESAALAGALLGGGTDVAGVRADDLDAARALVRSAGRVVVVLGRPSLAESAESVVAAAAALRRALPEATFLSALRRANVHGALDLGLAPGILPGRTSLDGARSWFEAAWGRVPAVHGLDTEDMLRAAAEGALDVLVLVGADPLQDFPDRALAARALDRVPTLVAVDIFPTASVARASIVLPAAAYGERGGTTTNLEGRIARLSQKVTPPGVAWPDWVIASELAARLGVDFGFGDSDDIWDEIERVAPAHRGITRPLLALAAREGVVAPLPAAPAPPSAPALDAEPAPSDVTPADPAAPDVTTDPTANPGVAAAETHGVPATAIAPDDGREEVDAAPAAVRTAERPPLLAFDPDVSPGTLPKADAYAMRVVATRKLWDAGVLTRRSPHLAPLAARDEAAVHPADLDRLGIADGGRVRLRSERHDVVLPVRADPGVVRGTVALVAGLAAGTAEAFIDADSTVHELRLETPR